MKTLTVPTQNFTELNMDEKQNLNGGNPLLLAVAGAALYSAIDYGVERYTGKDIGEHGADAIGSAISAVGGGLSSVGDWLSN